jgi:NAD(P)-dependent dehydrogenase (short-subunit alcohol dehydrogenase family)
MKRVAITGAASGIGAATLGALRRHGASVAGLDIQPQGDLIACDVRDQASVDSAVAEAVERLGGLDVLINCAGIGLPQRAGDRPGEDALAVVDVNFFGPWRVTAAALPALLASGGRVVNIASGLAFVTIPFVPAYCASKRGLAAYGDALRLEHGDAISVTTVYPGYVRTPIHAPAAAIGMSLEGIVPAEPMSDAVAVLVRCALGPRPPRHVATTRGGAFNYWALRHLPPGLVARAIERRVRRWRREHPLQVTVADPPRGA